MTEVVVYGAAYSVYVRIVRLALLEKGVEHSLEEVDVFAEEGPPAEHLRRHPFGRIPAFRHDDFELYETAAIVRYIDDEFAGPSLTPDEPRSRARMNQIVGILDSYGYRTLVWDIFVERLGRPQEGGVSDESRIAAALPRAATVLAELARLKGGAPFLAGAALSLADLHAAPMIAYFRLTPEGARLLGEQPAIAAWWAEMAVRPSLLATRYRLETLQPGGT